jgi:hypothetical protein
MTDEQKRTPMQEFGDFVVNGPKGNKMKTADLEGAALDWAVAKCDGIDIWREPDGIYLCEGGEVSFRYRPSTKWSQGGPIIEREKIGIFWRNKDTEVCAGKDVIGKTGRKFYLRAFGPTPLIAAMRCYVASRLGDEVDVPEELK